MGSTPPFSANDSSTCSKVRLQYMFPRIDGLRTLVLGEPGSELQERLNLLVLGGIKTGTSSVDDGEYAQENEEFETVGEKQWLIDGAGKPIALIEYTSIDWVPFSEVSMDFVLSEGEGFQSLEEWQIAHKAFWSTFGLEVSPTTKIICYSFRVLERL